MGDDEFEEQEAKARAQGEPGVEQPEGGRRHRLGKPPLRLQRIYVSHVYDSDRFVP